MNQFINLIKPKKIKSNKIRLGPKSDGGYVIPENDLSDCVALFTYGVGNNYIFEKEFEQKYKKPVFMFDHTIKKENYKEGLINFFNEGLGFQQNCKDFLFHYKNLKIEGKVFLKIDIEGSEYDYLEKINLNNLNPFVNGICIELHDLHIESTRKRAENILARLSKFYSVCHVHGNNNSSFFVIDEKEVPSVLEITLTEKSRALLENDESYYPINNLDYPNNPDFFDFDFGFINPKIIPHYTESTLKNTKKDIVHVGTNQNNTKFFKLRKTYNNPVFKPRKNHKWNDKFQIDLIEDNTLKIRRTDANLGWGAPLILDVEFEISAERVEVPEQKIPRIIYQTFKSYNVPNGMYDAVESWKTLNPEYEHYFFNDEDCISFIEKHFDQKVLGAYLDLIPGAYKADLFRYCVLYEKGGVYADADMICLKSLNEYVQSDDEFIIARDDPMSKSYLYNAFIAIIPKHKFMLNAIEKIVSNVNSKTKLYHLDISGPGLLGKSVNESCQRKINEEYVLGSQEIDGTKINILMHDWKSKTIKSKDANLVFTEYLSKDIEMNRLNIPTYYSLYQKNIVYREIPRKIWCTSFDCIGKNVYMIDSFRLQNKYWNIEHHDDAQCYKFFVTNKEKFLKELGIDVSEFYFNLENSKEKTELWRYCVLYLFGGVYADIDTICVKPLNDWTRNHDLVLGYENKLFHNWLVASKPKHEFIKNIIINICSDGKKRIAQHIVNHFEGCDFSKLDNQDLEKDKSIILCDKRFNKDSEDVYVIHKSEGSSKFLKNKSLKTYKCPLGVSHNLTIRKNQNGYMGVSRLDKDASRTKFMEKIGDCRSLVEFQFDQEFNLVTEQEKPILNCKKIAKFEDYRFFNYKNENYLSVSYIDKNFNTKMAILDSNYNFLGDVKIDGNYNKVGFTKEPKIWEKNWLFFENKNKLYFIYSTNPRYVVYECSDFKELEFFKSIDQSWDLPSPPDNESYFTKAGTSNPVATGGSCNPILLDKSNKFLYLIHTKLYNQRRYNHYAVVLDEQMNPINICLNPIISKLVPYGLLFISSVVEEKDYLIFSGGIEDNQNFIWPLSKEFIFKKIGI